MIKNKQLQSGGSVIYPYTHENIVLDDAGNNIPEKYQTKEDIRLNTVDKTIVGAINEIMGDIITNEDIDNMINEIFI